MINMFGFFDQIGKFVMSFPDQLEHMSMYSILGFCIVIAIISAIYQSIKRAIFFFYIRPRDPELYKQYKADRRAHEIANAQYNSARQIFNSIDRSSLMNYDANQNWNFHDYNNPNQF